MGLDSLGNFGVAAQHKANAGISQSNARIARAQGQAEKGKAYGQATRLEMENTVAGEQAAENMSRLRKAQRQAGADARAARAVSGFTSEGSGSQPEISVLSRYEQAAQDMVYSRSLQDSSARFQATMLRRSGDIAEMGAIAQADYLTAQSEVHKMKAHNANKAAVVSASLQAVGAIVGGIAGGPAGAMQGAQMGAGMGSMYSAGLPGTLESEGGRNKDAEKDFAAGLTKGLTWLMGG